MGLVYRDTPLPSGGAVGGRPGAPACGQHQSARPFGQRRWWVCPSWQISPSFLPELLGGQQTAGGGGKPSLAYLDHTARGAAGSQEAPLKTLASRGQAAPSPAKYLRVRGGTTPFCAVTSVPRALPSPRVGRKSLVLSVLGTGNKH